MNFNSHTDAVVSVTVALVNAATPGMRRGRPYPAPAGVRLREAINEALAHGGRRVTHLNAAQAGALADEAARLRAVFEQVEERDLDAAARTVNALLAEMRPTPYLESHDGEPWHLHYHSPTYEPVASWAGSCSLALAIVLGGEYASRLGVCAAPQCDRVYVDVSRNGTRRFCSTACQNRVKAAAHRARAGH